MRIIFGKTQKRRAENLRNFSGKRRPTIFCSRIGIGSGSAILIPDKSFNGEWQWVYIEDEEDVKYAKQRWVQRVSSLCLASL